MRIHRAHLRHSALALFQRLFPERQIFFRSEGEVHFKRLSPRFQIAVACIAVIALLWIFTISISFFSGDARLAAKDKELRYVSGEIDALLGELSRLQTEALTRANRIEQRQRILDSLIGDIADDTAAVPADAAGAPTSEPGPAAPPSAVQESFLRPAAAAPTLLATLIGAAGANAKGIAPETALARTTDFLLDRLERIAAHQNAQAAALAEREEKRLREAHVLIARLGLQFNDLLAPGRDPAQGAGGPFLSIPEDRAAPAFQQLLDLVGTRRQVDATLMSIPSRIPVDNYYISSRFGQRRDPFRKTWAMHSGVDMAGWPGEPIHAAGEGLVIKSGRAPAYGLMVEIDHGNGFHTRYGHMRKLKVKAGERVTRGAIIGEMGTSGRSTSTHLHWEVWFRGKLVDPLRYLEASEDVYALQDRVRSGG